MPIMFVSADGTGVPMRKEELAGRAGKQPDGTAKTRAWPTWDASSPSINAMNRAIPCATTLPHCLVDKFELYGDTGK